MQLADIIALAIIAVILAGIFYTIVIAVMAFVGLILSTQTRGERALHLLAIDPHDAVFGGRVAVTGRESILSWMYSFALFVGLLLFYCSIPFVLTALLLFTGGA